MRATRTSCRRRRRRQRDASSVANVAAARRRLGSPPLGLGAGRRASGMVPVARRSVRSLRRVATRQDPRPRLRWRRRRSGSAAGRRAALAYTARTRRPPGHREGKRAAHRHRGGVRVRARLLAGAAADTLGRRPAFPGSALACAAAPARSPPSSTTSSADLRARLGGARGRRGGGELPRAWRRAGSAPRGGTPHGARRCPPPPPTASPRTPGKPSSPRSGGARGPPTRRRLGRTRRHHHETRSPPPPPLPSPPPVSSAETGFSAVAVTSRRASPADPPGAGASARQAPRASEYRRVRRELAVRVVPFPVQARRARRVRRLFFQLPRRRRARPLDRLRGDVPRGRPRRGDRHRRLGALSIERRPGGALPCAVRGVARRRPSRFSSCAPKRRCLLRGGAGDARRVPFGNRRQSQTRRPLGAAPVGPGTGPSGGGGVGGGGGVREHEGKVRRVATETYA